MMDLLWILQLLLVSPTIAQLSPAKKSRDFIFPDSNLACLDGNVGSNDKTYCNKVKNYPTQHELESILRNEFSQLDTFVYEDVLLPDVMKRVDVEEIELCSSRQKIVYPQGGYTADNTWKLILNNKDTFKQGVRVEECINEGETCHAVILPNHYTAICEQKYNLRTLWALTENKTRVMDSFKMPSCCQCVVKRMDLSK